MRHTEKTTIKIPFLYTNVELGLLVWRETTYWRLLKTKSKGRELISGYTQRLRKEESWSVGQSGSDSILIMLWAGLDDRRFPSGGTSPTHPKWPLGPTENRIYWVPTVPSFKIKRPKHEASSEVKTAWRLYLLYPTRTHLWWTKWRRGRFSPSTSVSPAKSVHSTNFIIIIIIIIITTQVPPIGEGPHVAPFKGATGSRVSKLAQRNVDFSLLIQKKDGVAMTSSTYYPNICLKGLRKTITSRPVRSVRGKASLAFTPHITQFRRTKQRQNGRNKHYS
jgi:hypothetical protein